MEDSGVFWSKWVYGSVKQLVDIKEESSSRRHFVIIEKFTEISWKIWPFFILSSMISRKHCLGHGILIPCWEPISFAIFIRDREVELIFIMRSKNSCVFFLAQILHIYILFRCLIIVLQLLLLAVLIQFKSVCHGHDLSGQDVGKGHQLSGVNLDVISQNIGWRKLNNNRVWMMMGIIKTRYYRNCPYDFG